MKLSRTFLLLAAAVTLLPACGKGGGKNGDDLLTKPAKGAAEVRTAKVGADHRVVIAGTGTLWAAQETVVFAEVPARVAKLLAEEGDLVKEGAPLLELETTDLQLGLRKAEADQKGAQLMLAETRLEFDRATKVHGDGALSQAALDGMQLKLDLTENGVKMATVGLDAARRRLAQAVIRAPYDALVVNRMASIGTLIQVMPPTAIYRLQDLRHLRLKIKVSEMSMRQVAEGDRIEARFEGAGRDVVAKVDTIIGSVDPMSRTFEVVANLDNDDHEHRLKPGAFATARILHEMTDGRALVSRDSTVPVPGKPDQVAVFVVEGGKAHRKTIRVEAVDAATLAVVDGLKTGDEIVTSDLSALSDGCAVVVAAPAAVPGVPGPQTSDLRPQTPPQR